MPKNESKNALFVYFWARILNTVFLFEICWIARFHEKTKKLKYGFNNDLVGFF